MSCTKLFSTKGVALAATPAKVLEHNIHRKALLIGVTGGPAQVAIGYTPDTLDYLTIVEGHPLVFDEFVPIGEVWVKGTGTIVYGESV